METIVTEVAEKQLGENFTTNQLKNLIRQALHTLIFEKSLLAVKLTV